MNKSILTLGLLILLRSAFSFSLANSTDGIKVHPLFGLSFYELVSVQGYDHENHTIETEDGYIMEIHRVPRGKLCEAATRGPILLMHGMSSSSVDFIIHPRNQSLGLLLADAGFDVWLGNARSNAFGRRHKTLDPDNDQEKFWDFSWHEIGVYDLPAIIDYILRTTKSNKIQYVGHSQGGTVFYVMASEKPEYLEKIKLMIGLSPAVYMAHQKNPFVKAIAGFDNIIWELLKSFEAYGLTPRSETIAWWSKELCSDGRATQELCRDLTFFMCGFSPYQLDGNFVPVFMTHAFSGMAVKQLLHYLQIIHNKGVFRKYNYYDEKINMEKYGSPEPPKYNLGHVNIPIATFYSTNDYMVADQVNTIEDQMEKTIYDLVDIAKELPNVIVSKAVPDLYFNHIDFIFGVDAKELLFDDILKVALQH